jgi:hypothetical protein
MKINKDIIELNKLHSKERKRANKLITKLQCENERLRERVKKYDEIILRQAASEAELMEKLKDMESLWSMF